MNVKIGLTIGFVAATVLACSASDGTDVTIQNLECFLSQEYAVNYTCRLDQADIGRGARFTFEVFFRKPVNNVILKLTIARKVKNKDIPIFGVKNITIDLCKYVRGAVQSNFLNMVLGPHGNSTNCMQPCPFQGHCYVRDGSLDMALNVFSAPIGQYSMKVLLFTKMGKREKFVASYVLHYAIKSINPKKPIRL